MDAPCGDLRLVYYIEKHRNISSAKRLTCLLNLSYGDGWCNAVSLLGLYTPFFCAAVAKIRKAVPSQN